MYFTCLAQLVSFLPNLIIIETNRALPFVAEAAFELPVTLCLEEDYANEYEYDGAHQDVDLI